jgi:SagB-type dehydrogenase family enzyme
MYAPRPLPLAELIDAVSARLHIEVGRLHISSRILLEFELLLPADTPLTRAQQHGLDLEAKWAKYDWTSAADYHYSTLDPSFIPGNPLGRAESADRMLQYSRHEPDDLRSRHYPDAKVRIPLPLPQRLEQLSQSLGNGPSTGIPGLDLICAILGFVFAPVRTRPVPWPGAPVFLKTSPSGGARHPTEAYLYSRNIGDLAQGLYHIDMAAPALGQLVALDHTATGLETAFEPIIRRCPFPTAAIVVFTTVFERNMYRYREARTFRSIHMDVGHLIETMCIACEQFSIRVNVQYCGYDSLVEEAIGLSFLEEGVQAYLAIGECQ